MSRRGNCHDNAVVESFFNLLKRERIRRRNYRSRDEARQDVFDYIEMFYNPIRKHVRNGMLCVIDDYTRECLALVADTSLSGGRVARELDHLIALRGKPRTVVSDNVLCREAAQENGQQVSLRRT